MNISFPKFESLRFPNKFKRSIDQCIPGTTLWGMNRKVVTLDGPCGVGKSTIGKLLGEELGFHYLSSGSIVRAIALLCKTNGVVTEDTQAILKIISTMKLSFDQRTLLINGKAAGSELYTPEMGSLASQLASKHPSITEFGSKISRELSRRYPLVIDGRVGGSHAFPIEKFPKGVVRFWVHASLENRVKWASRMNPTKAINEIESNLVNRDDADFNRTDYPTIIPHGAISIEKTGQEITTYTSLMIKLIRDKLKFLIFDYILIQENLVNRINILSTNVT